MVKSGLIINGWNLYQHPLFEQQLNHCINKVEKLKINASQHYKDKKPTKILTAIYELAFKKIPENPSRPEYRQGDTLGPHYKHWFRAEFFQQYRLFFRYHQESKLIIYAWVNDDSCLRAYESKSDAYKIFRQMLENGHPPDDWEALSKEINNRFPIFEIQD